jgi:hypothetical protein
VHTRVLNTRRLACLSSGPRSWGSGAAGSPGYGVHMEIVAVKVVWLVEDQG